MGNTVIHVVMSERYSGFEAIAAYVKLDDAEKHALRLDPKEILE